MDIALERAVMAKVTRRLIPFLFLLYICAFLDRVNVGFAALQMKHDLHLSDAVYGMGAGIFFVGYFLFEIPSNLILERVGARLWIARIMITWGIISSATMFVQGGTSFYVLRFLLGVAEAGFFPGMILYLTYWFPATERARAVARFMTAVAISGVVGGPLSAALLSMEGVAGLHGWQWLFLVEGIPSFLLGFVVLVYLTDRPEQAHWLQPEERDYLIARLQQEREHKERHRHFTLAQAFAHPKVLLLCIPYFMTALNGYGVTLWLPQIMQSRSGWSAQTVSLAVAFPNLVAAICMVIVGTHSDRTRERRWHLALSAFVSAVGMTLAAQTHSPILSLLAFAVAYAGITSTLGPFWALPTSFLSGTAAAGGIAFINSIGNMGGYVGPSVMGWLKQSTGSFAGGLYVLAGGMVVCGVFALLLRHDPALERVEAAL